MKNMRKQYQRKFNKMVRETNKALEADNLWKGRFVFKQINADFIRFDDGSGGILRVIIRGYDKATGYYKDYYLDYAPFFRTNDYHLWETVNNFIVEDAGTWEREPRPSLGTAIDYTKWENNDFVWTAKKNFYTKYEG